MRLERLRIRDKLNLLVLIPLAVVVLLLVPLLVSGIHNAQLSARTARTATIARSASAFIEDVQTARLLSVAYLSAPDVEPNSLQVQLALLADSRAQLRALGVEDDRSVLVSAIDTSASLAPLGRLVVARSVSAQSAADAFGAAVDGVVDSLALTSEPTAGNEDSMSLGALDALLRSDEAASRSGALLLAGAADPKSQGRLVSSATRYSGLAAASAQQFLRLATPEVAQAFSQAGEGPSAARVQAAATALAGTAGNAVAPPAEVFTAVRSVGGLRQLVESTVSQGVAVAADSSAARSRVQVGALIAFALALLFGVVFLSVVIGRSVSRPLRQLTEAAGNVADIAQQELMRVADEDATVSDVPRLAAIEVRSGDEIGEMAEAFNRVQATAALLLERQMVSRRNVASMFASVGRRTSNLVGRQLNLVDALERGEDDPDTLATLYRLDHVSTRLRRSASSLIVLSGESEASTEGRPLPLVEGTRAALGTIEDYQRVTIGEFPDVDVSPAAASDVVLMLAELIENAVLFSPPRTTVEVSASVAADGSSRLVVVDHGMGMPADRIVEENARLRRRERLDLAPSNVLGLFVVGRIARRHGLDVQLEPTPEHGITASVRFPAELLVSAEPVTVQRQSGGERPEGPRRDTLPAGDPRRDLRRDSALERVVAERVSAVGNDAAAGRLLDALVARGAAPATTPDTVTAAVPLAAGTESASARAVAPPPGDAPGQAEASTQAPGSTQGQVSASAPADSPPLAAETLTQRAPGSHWQVSATTGRTVPVNPSIADVRRRVPGEYLAAMEGVEGSAAAVPGRAQLDPDEARRQVEDVEIGLARAEDTVRRAKLPTVESASSVGPPPAQATSTDVPASPDAGRAGLVRRVRGAALDDLERADPVGRGPVRVSVSPVVDPDEARRQIDDVVEGVEQARAVETAQPVEPVERVELAGPPPGALPPRRVPGAALASLGQGMPTPGAVGPVAGRLPAKRLAARPEHPDDVLAWVSDLETSLAEANVEGGTPDGPSTDIGTDIGTENGEPQ